MLADAQRIDANAKRVYLDEGHLDYDYLIVATGATHAYFGHPEWEQFAPGLKTLDNALEVRRRMLLAYEIAERDSDPVDQTRLLTFVIVGGGPTGVELAGAIAEIARQTLADEFRTISTMHARVVLVEAGPTILSTFPADLRDKARESLLALGVEVLENTRVTDIDASGVSLAGVRIEAGTVLWAAGVAASPLGQSLGVPLDRAGRVYVRPELNLEEHPEVYVIGDLASLNGADGKPLPGVAPVAQQQAAHAAKNIVRAIARQPLRPFKYFNWGNLATIGRATAIADFGRMHLSGYLGWLFWLFVHIMKLVGFRNRVLVFIQWASVVLHVSAKRAAHHRALRERAIRERGRAREKEHGGTGSPNANGLTLPGPRSLCVSGFSSSSAARRRCPRCSGTPRRALHTCREALSGADRR